MYRTGAIMLCLVTLLSSRAIAQSLPASSPTSAPTQAAVRETAFSVWYNFWSHPRISAKYPREFFIGLTPDGRAWKIFESGPPEGPFASLEALLLSSALKKNTLNPAYKKNPFPKVPCSTTAVEGGAHDCSCKPPGLAAEGPTRQDPWSPTNQKKSTALKVGTTLLLVGTGAMLAGGIGVAVSDDVGGGIASVGILFLGAAVDLISLVPFAMHVAKKRQAKQ